MFGRVEVVGRCGRCEVGEMVRKAQGEFVERDGDDVSTDPDRDEVVGRHAVRDKLGHDPSRFDTDCLYHCDVPNELAGALSRTKNALAFCTRWA